MRPITVVWTEAALRDLDQILAFTAENYPTLVDAVERRIHSVVERVSTWPAAARTSDQRPDVRVVAVLKYPYRIFYQVTGESIEILHIRHTAREPWLD